MIDITNRKRESKAHSAIVMAIKGKLSVYVIFLVMTFGSIGLVSFQSLKERKNLTILVVAKNKEIIDLNNQYEVCSFNPFLPINFFQCIVSSSILINIDFVSIFYMKISNYWVNYAIDKVVL